MRFGGFIESLNACIAAGISLTQVTKSSCASLINFSFFNECKKGYNLSTIYHELYNELLDKGIDISITYSIKIGIQYYTNHTGYTSTYLTNVSNSSSFMWCNLFNTYNKNKKFKSTFTFYA